MDNKPIVWLLDLGTLIPTRYVVVGENTPRAFPVYANTGPKIMHADWHADAAQGLGDE